uniref:Putative transposase insk for insertion sequence element is150 n=1 Tax=Staphylococcus aureus TaxID=1280 RepID=M1XHH8_STAAU|nr:putative transposase insk for insertion sequence element is150 [Staphylococcus aureus]
MSRKGTPADNAPIESFHSLLKSETFYINNQLNSSNHIVIDIVENLSPVKYRELIA